MADSDDPELGIRIDVEADTSGAAAADQAIDNTTKKVAGLSGELRNLRRGLGATRNSTAIFEGIERAAEGGTQAIVGAARAFRGLFMIVAEGAAASGPIGLLIVGLGAIVGLMIALGHHSKAAGDGMKKASEDADGLKAALKEAAKESKVATDQMKEDAETLTHTYDALLKRMEDAEKRIEGLQKADAKFKETSTTATFKEDQASLYGQLAGLKGKEASELRNSGTPEQTEAIKAKYVRLNESLKFQIQQSEHEEKLAVESEKIKTQSNELEQKIFNSNVEIENATREKAKAQAVKDSNAQQVATTQQQADEDLAIARDKTRRAIDAAQAAGGLYAQTLRHSQSGDELDAVSSLGTITGIDKLIGFGPKTAAEDKAIAAAKLARDAILSATTSKAKSEEIKKGADANDKLADTNINLADQKIYQAKTVIDEVAIEVKSIEAEKRILAANEKIAAAKEIEASDKGNEKITSDEGKAEHKEQVQATKDANDEARKENRELHIEARAAAKATADSAKAVKQEFRHIAVENKGLAKSISEDRRQKTNAASYAP